MQKLLTELSKPLPEPKPPAPPASGSPAEIVPEENLVSDEDFVPLVVRMNVDKHALEKVDPSTFKVVRTGFGVEGEVLEKVKKVLEEAKSSGNTDE